MNSTNLTIKLAYEKLRSKEISAVELTKSYLARIKDIDENIGAYLEYFEDDALKQAKDSDERIANDSKSNYLDGIPMAVKDVILIQNKKNTCGSKILENYIASYDATAIKKLKKAGAVILGKTNCDEFAMGSSNENSAYGPVKNPYDLSRVPGGSSGGSAAAVSADECVYALGSDTGGSIRQPAAFCNIVGLKPTYGRVSRYGLSAMASSFDQIGTFTKTVEDAAWVFSMIAGTDKKDSTCITEAPPEFFNNIYPGVKGKKIGIIKQGFGEGINTDIKSQVMGEIDKLKKLGAQVSEIDMPNMQYALPVYYIIMPSEVSSNMARYDGVRYGFSKTKDDPQEVKDLIEVYMKSRAEGLGDEVKRRIMIGTYALSSGYYDAYYKKAQKVRSIIINDFKEAFKKFDVLITPTVPDIAFKLGEKVDDPLSMYLNDILTVSANVAGLPAMSVPCGFVDNMPVGMQIMANYFDEKEIFEVGLSYELNNNWRDIKPAIK